MSVCSWARGYAAGSSRAFSKTGRFSPNNRWNLAVPTNSRSHPHPAMQRSPKRMRQWPSRARKAGCSFSRGCCPACPATRRPMPFARRPPGCLGRNPRSSPRPPRLLPPLPLVPPALGRARPPPHRRRGPRRSPPKYGWARPHALHRRATFLHQARHHRPTPRGRREGRRPGPTRRPRSRTTACCGAPSWTCGGASASPPGPGPALRGAARSMGAVPVAGAAGCCSRGRPPRRAGDPCLAARALPMATAAAHPSQSSPRCATILQKMVCDPGVWPTTNEPSPASSQNTEACWTSGTVHWRWPKRTHLGMGACRTSR
mmetsp:Transcript_119179/g.379910  ORF Transcript_119179/g.379910 Transcript_119179/m.379910 type:complete len:316 (+) Transcript_119179:705-1652(+)